LLSFPRNLDPEKATRNGRRRISAAESWPVGSHTELARQLLALERGVETHGLWAAEVVCQKLSQRLSRLVSQAGAQAMLSRALHLARAEFPFLAAVRARREGCLDGLAEAVLGVGARAADTAMLTVLTNLIDLLVGFIGEELTTLLAAESWTRLALPFVIQSETRDDGQEAAS
jgi:hypothetical protein